MKKITAELNEALKNFPEGKELYEFKQKKIDELTARFSELLESGMTDTKVCEDIILSEHPDFASEFKAYMNKKTKKHSSRFVRSGKSIFLLSALLTLLDVFVYLAVSFMTNAWSKTWLIIFGGIVLQLGLFSVLAVTDKIRKHTARNIGARILCFAFVITLFVFFFLIGLVANGNAGGYIFIILGVAVALIVDLIISFITKSKFAFGKFIAYLPFITALFYVPLCLVKVLSWHPGWLLIFGAVVLDFILLVGRVVFKPKSKYEYEEVE